METERLIIDYLKETEKERMENLRLRRSARKDSERIDKLIDEYYFELVPVLEGFSKKEELVCKKIVDKQGNIIAGCSGYIFPWGCMYIDDMWVNEKYRRQGLGSVALQAVESEAERKGCHVLWIGTWISRPDRIMRNTDMKFLLP